jgi:hypothetical protein
MALGDCGGSAGQSDCCKASQNEGPEELRSILHNITKPLIGADGMAAALVTSLMDTCILRLAVTRFDFTHYDSEIRCQFKKARDLPP